MGRISTVTLASQSPGVIVVVDAIAVVPAILVTVQQLLIVAGGLAPSPFTLRRRMKINNRKNKTPTGTITPSESTSVAHHLFKVSSLSEDDLDVT